MNFNITSPIQGTLGGIVSNTIEIFFALAGVIALFYLILGGYNYIASAGNPESVEGAKATITNAIIGLIVVLISYLVISFLLERLGVGSFSISL